MDNIKRLSVITINLNNKSGLEKTIKSVLNQTFNNFEYIIIDGASTDGSAEIIKQYSDKLAYWISEPDSGVYNAMNKGRKQAKSKIITFLNSGDEYYSAFSLEMAFNFLKIKWSFAELFFFDYIYQAGNDKMVVSSLDVTNKYRIYNKGFGHPSTFYKKKLFELLGDFDESYKIAADRAFYMKAIVENKLAFAYFPFAVSVFHEGGLSTISNCSGILAEEDKRITDTFYNNFEKRIIGMRLFRRIFNIRYIHELLVWILNWELKQI
jgi:glycosyltransferase involved in cell wall biosynthesis